MGEQLVYAEMNSHLGSHSFRAFTSPTLQPIKEAFGEELSHRVIRHRSK